MIDLNTLISPSLGIQLRNVATINERGEMAVVAFFPDGSHRPVLLIPCDDQSTDGEGRQDSISLDTTHMLQRAFRSVANSVTPTLDSRSVPIKLRDRLARRYEIHRQTLRH
jgi:hypothetical protein